MAMGLVVLVISEARDPANYAWLVTLCGGESAPAGAPIAAEASERIEGDPADEEAAAGRYHPGVKPELLRSISDNTIFGNEEKDAWFHLLDILKRTDEATLARRSTGRATYAQLDKQSSAYRGELVTVLGTIRRARRISKIPENDVGIDHYYQLWLFTADNPTLPMVVYCLYLPEGFPIGKEVEAEATIHGFYFKRWLTNAQTPPLERPMMLARTVQWQKPRPAKVSTMPVNSDTMLPVLGVAIGLALCVVVFVYLKTRSTKPGESEPPDFDAIRLAVVSDVEPPSDAIDADAANE